MLNCRQSGCPEISPVLFECLEELRINESVKMNIEGHVPQTRARVQCQLLF